MASSAEQGDKYRDFMYGEGEKDTVWRFGAPPNYDVVNKLFEEGRTQVKPSPLSSPALALDLSSLGMGYVVGVAGGFAGREGAEAGEDMGNGVGPQGAAGGLQVHQSTEVSAQP